MNTNTKHTPGPWHIGSGNGEGSIFADNGRTRLEIGGTTLYPICQVNRKWEDEEDEANARTIAAAPELLASLAEAVDELEQMHRHYYGNCPGGCPACVAIDKARAAIAKATAE